MPPSISCENQKKIGEKISLFEALLIFFALFKLIFQRNFGSDMLTKLDPDPNFQKKNLFRMHNSAETKDRAGRGFGR